jgi:hypothetical protein
MVAGFVAGVGAVYNKLQHGEVLGDEGIDIPRSALMSGGLTFATNSLHSGGKTLHKNKN